MDRSKRISKAGRGKAFRCFGCVMREMEATHSVSQKKRTLKIAAVVANVQTNGARIICKDPSHIIRYRPGVHLSMHPTCSPFS